MKKAQLIYALSGFAVGVAKRFVESRCLQLAASLSFTTLVALVPLITVVLAVISAMPGAADFTGQLDRFIAENMLPEKFGGVIRQYVEQFAANAGRLTVIGIGMLVVTAFSLMHTIERAFHSIWRSRRSRPLGRRVAIYVATLSLGPVLIGISLTITSYAVSISLGLVHGMPWASELILRVTPLAFTVTAFTLLYFLVPAQSVRFAHALIGGVVAGALFELMKRGFALYVTMFPTYTVIYGAFASVPVFLLWVYCSWVVTVFGAVVASLLQYGDQSGPRARNDDA